MLKMNYSEHLPFILRYFYRDIKSVYGSVTKVSAVCRMCSKTFQGSLHSTSVFESHLKSKGHEGLHEEYLKIRPRQSTESMNHTNAVDGPIVKLFKSLITNDYKENTVLSNTHIIDILEKEFFVEVKNTHELEVEIYMNVVKKYLKDWPEWDAFEQAANDINLEDSASVELLRKNHIKLKDYLCGFLDIAKHLAPDVTRKIPNLKQVVLDDNAKDSDVVMEITATKSQLNNLIMRHPKNNNIFNIKEPDIEWAPQAMGLDSIINSCGITIEMRLKYTKTEMLLLKYENRHMINHNLVNRKLNTKLQVAQLQQEWQVKYRKKKNGDLFKETIPNLLYSYKLNGERIKWKKLFVSIHKILNNIMQNMPVRIDSSADYKKHLSPYKFVRYFYSNCEESGSGNYKYDIRLEEIITPMCMVSIGFYPKGEQGEVVMIHCDTCQMRFSGFDVLKDVEEHVANCHDAEPDWSCMNCKQTMDVASLTEMNWQHKCPHGPVASSSIQTTLIV